MTNTSFFDELSDELRLAGERLTPPPVATPPRRRLRALAVARPRLLAVVGAVAVVATPALAVTQPWAPILGRPELGDTPSTTTSAVPRATAAAIGVLRRPQTDADRGPQAQALLRHLGTEHRGARLGSARLLTAADGYTALLVSDERLDDGAGGTTLKEPLCLLFHGGGTCGDLQAAEAGSLFSMLGPRAIGLVPDGVAAVALRFGDHHVVLAPVTDNFFSLVVSDTIATVPGHPQTPLMPKVQWRDADGRTIGP